MNAADRAAAMAADLADAAAALTLHARAPWNSARFVSASRSLSV